MINYYKVILSNKNYYKEISLNSEMTTVSVGTEMGIGIRLRKEYFFGEILLTFMNMGDVWNVSCSDNLYFNLGDIRKLSLTKLSHGSEVNVCYQDTGSVAFSINFLIDFEFLTKDFNYRLDISNKDKIVIGGQDNADIIISDKYVDDDSIMLVKQKEGMCLENIKSRFGTFVNGVRIKDKKQIFSHDFFSIAGFSFYYDGEAIWTENKEGITAKNIQGEYYPKKNEYPRFKRNSRKKIKIDEEKITVLGPPNKPQKTKSNLLISLLPSLGMMVASGLMASMGGTMVAFSLITGGMAIVTTVITTVQNRVDYKKQIKNRIETYNKYIEEKKDEIEESRIIERDVLNKIYVSQDIEQERIDNFSEDLFDREIHDEDFLSVRLGTGTVKAKRVVEYKKQERLEAEDDLQKMPKEVAEQYKYLDEAPVICDFKECDAIGILGEERFRFEIMKNIVMDISTRQFYSDVKLFFIATKEHCKEIEWLRFLPHVNDEQSGLRNIVCDDESKNAIFDYLYKEFSSRKNANDNEKGTHFIMFFYDEYGLQSHPLSKFIEDAKKLNATFVFMANEKKEIPQGCNYLIELTKDNEGILSDTKGENEDITFCYQYLPEKVTNQFVQMLAPTFVEEISLEAALTKNITLYEMLGILDSVDLDLKERWDKSQVYNSMAAPIGVSKTETVMLDLHDKAHGPHGLVAGTTGSGKSELLQTYILTMATLYHPYEVAFVIIDFKGGGMVNQFKELPHLLGAITNIDGKEINRSLKSIKAELQKRQRLFAEADVNHIDKYIKKYKEGKVSIPIPHLILIVDEFAELKAEQPDFMKELISAARIGRSLGVHLILATQKPSGQVDDQIWSNSRFKLCLKVQTQEDSNEVLKSPLAAEIKEPGRAYLQVGNNEIFELFQSAYSGAPEHVDDSGLKEFSIYNVRNSGKRIPIFTQKHKKSEGTNITQLEAVVKYVSEYCCAKNIKGLENICLPSLPKVIEYSDEYLCKRPGVSIGRYDDPDNQIQDNVILDIDNKNTLIIGSSQYGKTNLIQLMIREIVQTYSVKEANIYILDFASMVLKNFEKLNHVGGVVCASEDEKLKNLFKLLFTEIAIRKEKLISVGVSSYSSYIEAGYTDIPRIYLFVDNLTALIELYMQDDDSMLNIIREGIAVGISTIICNSQTSGIGYKYMSNFANKIALHCNDSTEYVNIFDHVSLQPDDVAGRCVLELEKHMLECQTYLAFDGIREIERVQIMHQFIENVNENNKGSRAKQIPYIPTVLEVASIKDEYGAETYDYKVPIGLTYNEVQPFYLDFSQLGIMGLCGKENTGRKNFVEYVLRTFEKNSDKYPVKVVIFDEVNRKFECFSKLSIVEDYTLDIESISDLISDWHKVLQNRYNNLMEEGDIGENKELLLLIVQNNDVAKKISENFDLMDKFNEILSKCKGMNVAIIFSNYNNASLSYDAPEPLRIIKQEQHIIFFEDLDNLKTFDVPYEDIRANKKRLEKGDAYYIQDNMVTKLKMVKADIE